jgi:P27 family predicted phage terminase small subunit
MGKRGPAPLPTAIKEARGTKRASRERARAGSGREPKPREAEPSLPPSVAGNADARKVWRFLVPQLLRLRVLTEIDGVALEGLCLAYARALAAGREVKKHGLLVKTSWNTLVQNPAVAVEKAAWIEVRKFAQEFGITPSSRSRVRQMPGEGDMPGDGDEQSAETFLFGNGAGRVVGRIG